MDCYKKIAGVFDLFGINKDVGAARFPHLFLYGVFAKKTTRKVCIVRIILVTLQSNRNVVSATKVTLIIHHLKHIKVMNKTVKKILQVISYIISLLLGAAGGSMIS